VTDYAWINGVNGDWSDSGVWDNGLPSSPDAVVTIAAGGTYTVNINDSEGFSVDSVTLNNAGTTLSVDGTLGLDNGFSIKAGTMTGAGLLLVTGGSIGGGTVAVATQSISGAVTLSAALKDTGKLSLGSSGADTLALGSNTLMLTGTGSTIAGTLTGTGMLALAGGTQAVSSGASLGMAKLAMSGGDSLTLNASLTYAGTLTQASGTALTVVSGKALTLTGSATLSGSVSGSVKVNNGKLVLDTDGTGAKLAVTGGSVSVMRNLVYNGEFADTGGTVMLGGRILGVAGKTTLTNATFMNGTLSTKGTTAVSGITIKGGADLGNFGAMTITGQIVVGDANTASKLVNGVGATMTLTSGQAASAIVGAAGGRNTHGLGSDTVTKPGTVMRNKGLVRLSKGGSRGGVRSRGPNLPADFTSSIAIDFENFDTGTIEVQSGTLEFDGSFTNANTKAGSISIAAGTALALNGGGSSAAGAFKVAAGGLLTISGGAFTLTAGTLQGAASLTGGALALTGAVTVSGTFAQSGGSSLAGAGVLTLAGAANFTGAAGTVIAQTGAGRTVIQGKATVGIDVALDGGRTLENDGTLFWTGGNFQLGRNPNGVSSGGGHIRNDAGATLVIAGNGVIGGYGSSSSLINSGTVIKSTSAGNATIAANFNNLSVVMVNKGTLELAGTVLGSGGSFKISNGSTLEVDAALPNTQKLVFGTGGGTLVLNDPAEYGASITGFGAHTAVDVTVFKFSGKPKVSFVEAVSKKQGVLTLTDGSQSLKITLFGQYVAAGFHLAADSGGGTVVTYAAPAAHVVLAAGH